MRTIKISSHLGKAFRDELERLVFFNPEQWLVTPALIDLVRRQGVPVIVEEDDRLHFQVQAFGRVQTLYAIDGTEEPERLIGVVMFTRVRRSSMVVLHLAIHEDYTSRGQWASELVVARLIGAVRNASLRTRGIRRLRILYPHEIQFDLRNR